MNVACAKCLARKAARLRPRAVALSEEALARAAELLERRYAAQPCPTLSNAIALHYLLLADHPAAGAGAGRDRYRQQALAWIRLAHGGPVRLAS